MLSPWDLPEPYVPRRHRPWLYILGAIAVALATLAAFTIPIPSYFAFLPGPVRDANELVVISDATTYPPEGQLLLTTVSVDTQVTLAKLIAAALDDNKDVVSADDVTGGESLEDTRQQQAAQMQESKQAAREVVLAALGIAEPMGDGARVGRIRPQSGAEGKLQPGDVIVAVDGVAVDTTCDVGREVKAHQAGETIDISVRRSDATVDFSVTLTVSPLDGYSTFLGVEMSDVNRQFDPGMAIRFETEEIGGPSAGLMFSLALYDQLTPGDLTAGRVIAGTGEIRCDGSVGAIGGVEEKIAAAVRAGATVFLAPELNAEAARQAAPGDIEVVPIQNFNDAVDFLEGSG